MNERAQLIRDQVSRDRLRDALTELGTLARTAHSDLNNEVVALTGALNRIEKKSRRNLVSATEGEQERSRIRHAILEILAELGAWSTRPILAAATGLKSKEPAKTTASIFLSYSHSDSDLAERLKKALESSGIEVRIDSTSLCAGEPIVDFIQRSIRETDFTISLVSADSLLSGWVAQESLGAFAAEGVGNRARFIACTADHSFFEPGFRLETTQRIDARLDELDKLIPQYLKQRLDIRDLRHDRDRLLTLRAGLGAILERLKEALTLDLRPPYFDQAVERMVKAIQGC